MDVSEAKHLKQLEEENCQLKELVANFTLDNHILKNVLAKNG
jgi:putative transposase